MSRPPTEVLNEAIVEAEKQRDEAVDRLASVQDTAKHWEAQREIAALQVVVAGDKVERLIARREAALSTQEIDALKREKHEAERKAAEALARADEAIAALDKLMECVGVNASARGLLVTVESKVEAICQKIQEAPGRREAPAQRRRHEIQKAAATGIPGCLQEAVTRVYVGCRIKFRDESCLITKAVVDCARDVRVYFTRPEHGSTFVYLAFASLGYEERYEIE